MAAFADDTNLLGNNDKRKLDTDQMVERAQEGFTLWNKLLHATGHFMELEKCACYLSIWSFQDDGCAYTMSPAELGKQIIVHDISGTQKTIPQLKTDESQKLLGVMKNPIGNQQDEIECLKAKSNRIAVQINTNALTTLQAK
jgi:hypothetical protein